MKGHSPVLKQLNELLAGELMARDQYFIHARMYENWGLGKLYERIWHEMQDETGHADWLIQRILFLEGTPGMVPAKAMKIGKTVPDMLKNDLAVEISVVKAVRATMAVCEAHQDYVSRDILLKMLDDTEQDHAHWLEQQLKRIELVGLENYIQSQMGDTPASA